MRERAHRMPGRAYCLFLEDWRGKPSEITIVPSWFTRTRCARICIERAFVFLRILYSWRVKCNWALRVRNDCSWAAWLKRGVYRGWFTAEVRHAAGDLTREFVSPRQDLHVSHPAWNVQYIIQRVIGGRGAGTDDSR